MPDDEAQKNCRRRSSAPGGRVVPRQVDTEDLTVERYELELDDGEQRDLLADPEAFVRSLFGEGHTINRLSIDTEILRGNGCSEYEVVHVVEGSYRSSHILQCVNPA